MFGNEELKQPELPEISPEEKELKTFVEVYEQLIELEARHNLKIIQIVQEHNMKLNRYETLAAAQRLNMEIDTELGEISTYRAIREDINRHKKLTLQKMEKILRDHQLERQRYGRILLKLKQDNAFREKIDSLRLLK